MICLKSKKLLLLSIYLPYSHYSFKSSLHDIAFLCPLKALGNQRFTDVFRGYGDVTLKEMGKQKDKCNPLIASIIENNNNNNNNNK